jgi:transmembrane sensor
MANEFMDGLPASEPELWEALARYVAGESPVEEADAIRAWLAADPSREALLNALDRSSSRLSFAPPSGLDVEAALRRVHARMDAPDVVPLRTADTRPRERARPRWRTTALQAAAVVALLLGAGLIWRATRAGDVVTPETAVARTWVTSPGQTDSIRLADGTRVLLGPGSRLASDASYGADRRDVELTGEALFEVVHDAARPFSVRAGAATILDLGTRFGVRSNGGNEVRVVVTEGSVVLRATAAPADSGVTLLAGDRGVLRADGVTIAERSTTVDDDLAWSRGRLVFADAPLSRVSDDLRRWYGVQLHLSDPSLARRHITATFEGETVREVLDVIALALGARIELRNDTAFVSGAAPAGRE